MGNVQFECFIVHALGNVFFQVQIVFQHYVISNLDKYFPRSNEFIPERWLKSCPAAEDLPADVTTNHHPFASLPFGYGKRMCLGRRFADLEIQTLLAKVGNITVDV